MGVRRGEAGPAARWDFADLRKRTFLLVRTPGVRAAPSRLPAQAKPPAPGPATRRSPRAWPDAASRPR